MNTESSSLCSFLQNLSAKNQQSNIPHKWMDGLMGGWMEIHSESVEQAIMDPLQLCIQNVRYLFNTSKPLFDLLSLGKHGCQN